MLKTVTNHRRESVKRANVNLVVFVFNVYCSPVNIPQDEERPSVSTTDITNADNK